jgi:hypothetical protein
MPSHPVGSLNTLIVKRGPYNSPYYLADPSFAKGVTPSHLTGFTQPFTDASKKCSAATKGMPTGKPHVLAMRECIKGILGRNR